MDNNNNSGNNFVGGFLLGAIFGALVVFLFGTKKGKKLLKIISEEGIENFSTIIDKAEESFNLGETAKDEELSITRPTLEEKIEDVQEHVEKPARRFFRGISKRVN